MAPLVSQPLSMSSQSSRPQISIVMPVYNAGSYLAECLQSIIDQDHERWQLVAVDDQSTDDSRAILKQFAASDHRITVLHGTRKGIIPSLQLAYSHTTGDYITRMDADDIMERHKLSSLLAVLENSDADVAVGKVQYFSTGKELADGYTRYATWLNSLIDANNHFDHVYKECVVPSPCWLMSRSTLDEIGAFQSDRYPEDYDLVFRMYAADLVVRGVENVLHLWRDHDSRASRCDENYTDQAFLPLKLHYFTLLEPVSDYDVLLWGAGSAGKAVAKLLNQRGLKYRWVTDNEKKIGKHIYDVQIESDSVLTDIRNHLIITAIRTPSFLVDNASLLYQLTRSNKIYHFY